MSSHFTYEIDERNLRVILKDSELEYKEEAWQRFEQYVNKQEENRSTGAFKNIQIPLNRCVILPVIFGLVVVFFAFLLFTFVNIKNTENDPKQKPESDKTVITFPEVKPEIQPPVTSKIDSRASDGINVKQTSTTQIGKVVIKRESGQIIPNKLTNPVLTPITKTDLSQTPVAPAFNSTLATVTSSQGINSPPPLIKKKKRRRTGEVIETQTIPESRPTISVEEREPEDRPN